MWPDIFQPVKRHTPPRTVRSRPRPIREIEIPTWLAKCRCTLCRGGGIVSGVIDHKRLHVLPCRCVRRAVFRAALNRYHWAELGAWQAHGFAAAAEIRADFELAARRGLGPEAWRFFRYVFLDGAGWRSSGVNRIQYFKAVYLLEEVIGLRIILTAGLAPQRPRAAKPRPAKALVMAAGKITPLEIPA